MMIIVSITECEPSSMLIILTIILHRQRILKIKVAYHLLILFNCAHLFILIFVLDLVHLPTQSLARQDLDH